MDLLALAGFSVAVSDGNSIIRPSTAPIASSAPTPAIRVKSDLRLIIPPGASRKLELQMPAHPRLKDHPLGRQAPCSVLAHGQKLTAQAHFPRERRTGIGPGPSAQDQGRREQKDQHQDIFHDGSVAAEMLHERGIWMPYLRIL